MANKLGIVVINKLQGKAVVIDVTSSRDSNIKKKEHKILKKYQGLKEEVGKMWEVKAAVVPVVNECCDSQTGRVAPTDSGNTVRDLCPEEKSSRNR